MRVLVVEGDPTLRGFLETVLTSEGFEVLSAISPAEADTALLLYPHAPDVVVLDLLLRGTNAVAYADSLLLRYPRIRVIFMFGGAEPEAHLIRHADDRGQLLHKPFSIERLLNAIRMPVQ